MSAKTNKADKLQSTVIIAGRFTERRAQLTTQPVEESAAEPLEPGSMVGRYLTLSRIGVGGMGIVYRAHDTELNRTVALKVLPPKLKKYPEYLKRFHTEAQAQARLNSPHVVTLYELMDHPVGQVLVLEYVEGETLESRLRHYGPLSVPEAMRVFEQAMRGVEHIHRMGVVHRDLKPSNIFITRDGEIKLMDFGIARLMDNHDPSQNGAMVGTLLYISPEQINGRETDCRSDVYTLGISLFEAVTGRLPFERRTDYGLMHAHVQENPPSPKEFQRRLPRELVSVILKAIAKDPNRRFQSVTEFRTALQELGLVERRQSADAGIISGTHHKHRSTENSSHRIWGGVWMDFSMVSAVFLLALILGFFPVHLGPSRNPSDEAMHTQAVKWKKASPANKPTESRETKAYTPQRVIERKDKYETLRQAWGG
ncbi:MAG: serine/threonine protein kinase [Sulfuricaulis sp.]|uniref:serine/threonine-protein kinase n=1 Tax=Sulfuricaulis sp. TaxID=2003553 RepID=UPI0025D8FCAD|nr:serine/threonine-protein kinase [Sulfuricaulis sp.]MCR4345620.1 serine/threonine protein kinase [Sulfuricaulis sp.]